jgi:hypothetical protein
MRALANEASRFPNIANMARLQIADALRLENKNAEAKQEYEDLLAKDYTSDEVRAGSWLGLGLLQFAEGNPANREAYREALLSFLRVYVETPNAAPAVVAESLHMGSVAAERWNGPDSQTMSRRLRSLCNRMFPENPWR